MGVWTCTNRERVRQRESERERLGEREIEREREREKEKEREFFETTCLCFSKRRLALPLKCESSSVLGR